MGNICQGISEKPLKSHGREFCVDSVRRLTLQNVRLTFLQSADHFVAVKVLLYLERCFLRHGELRTTSSLTQSVISVHDYIAYQSYVIIFSCFSNLSLNPTVCAGGKNDLQTFSPQLKTYTI